MSDPEQNLSDTLNWGGDGADLHEPVRAHVLAALLPTSAPYLPPVAALLTLGTAHEQSVQAQRDTLGIGQEHLPDLVRMARDRVLHSADEEDPAGWAPIHAVLLLSKLDVTAVVAELVPLLDIDNEWFSSSLPEALGRVGQPALPFLGAYLTDHARWVWGRTHAITALEEISTQHPDLRDEVVALLSEALRGAEHDDEIICSYAMHALVKLAAVEALPLIRHAFELGKIDEMVRGDWPKILNDLGVEPEPGDPLVEAARQRDAERRKGRQPLNWRATRDEMDSVLQSGLPPGPPGTQRRAQDQARKEKHKRKQATASRKANRKKRK